MCNYIILPRREKKNVWWKIVWKKKREKKTIFSYLWLSYSVRKVRRNFFLNFEAVFLYELHSILPLGCIDHDIYNWTMTFKHNMYSLTLYLTFFRENDRKKIVNLASRYQRQNWITERSLYWWSRIWKMMVSHWHCLSHYIDCVQNHCYYI